MFFIPYYIIIIINWLFSSSFVWPLTQEQFALGDPTRGQQKPPNNIASGITVETVIPIS